MPLGDFWGSGSDTELRKGGRHPQGERQREVWINDKGSDHLEKIDEFDEQALATRREEGFNLECNEFRMLRFKTERSRDEHTKAHEPGEMY